MPDLNRPIGALVKTTLVDFPARVACALFLSGCNLRCPYCHNRDLVIGSFADYQAVSANQVVEHLQKRRGVIGGFVISGGEPLMSPYLTGLITQAREFGYAIKLDTNGMFPAKLQELLKSPVTRPDFIALDIKTAPERYGELLASPPAENAAQKSANNLIESIKIISELPASQREFRTVLVPGLVGKKDLRALALHLPQDASWQLARFSNKNCLSPAYNALEPYEEQMLRQLTDYAHSLIAGAQLR